MHRCAAILCLVAVVHAGEAPPPAWPSAVVYVGDDTSVYTSRRPDAWGVCFRVDATRAYTEFDLPCPIRTGRSLWLLAPAQPGVQPRKIVDAGKGVLGSPRASWDGRWIYLSMAAEGDAFFHIWRLPSAGGKPEKLTDGNCHDIDPVELPDGRIAFASTRIGTWEEYHHSPSRALFTMGLDGSRIAPLTATSIWDTEPTVLADGRIAFMRTDNFFDRAKVETLIHVINPDGTGGVTAFGADNGPAYGNRLRQFGYGSPAALADGRLAFLSNRGNFIGRPGDAQESLKRLPNDLGDLAPLPDGRLLVSLIREVSAEEPPPSPEAVAEAVITGQHKPAPKAAKAKKPKGQRYPQAIAICDPADNRIMVLLDAPGHPVHSPAFIGARPAPPARPAMTAEAPGDGRTGTGFLHCQNVHLTRNTTAGWKNVRAIRVLAAIPPTSRSSHSHIVHAGTVIRELGTVPLAPDGSFSIEVPADTPLSLQAVDAEGRSEINEMSWIFVKPGEHRSCVGCHQSRQMTPPSGSARPQAFALKPLVLTGQGAPHHFRGNNAAVNGLMDLQFERFREVASIDRRQAVPPAGGEVAGLIRRLVAPDAGERIAAAQRLALERDQSAAAALAPLLTDGLREVRVAAALALAACGTRDSLPALLAALAHDDALTAQAAAVAFENLTGRAVGIDVLADAAQRAEKAAAARVWSSATGWDGIERELVAKLEGDDAAAVRLAAVALGHVAGEAGCAALRRFVEARTAVSPYKPYRNNRCDNFTFDDASPLNPRTLQAAVRALGHRRDAQALPLLERLLKGNLSRETGNQFLAEAVADALGCYRDAAATRILVEAFAGLEPYHRYVGWYGDHDALWACHASPIHVRIIAALDNHGASIPELVPALIRSMPTDPDRALLHGSDDYENLVGRAVRRSGQASTVIEACLAKLGDDGAKAEAEAAPVARAGLDGAAWIWHAADGGNPPPGERHFRTSFAWPADRKAVRAQLSATADNTLMVRLNGQEIANGNDWQAVADGDALAALRPGTNSLEVVAVNGGEAPNPAGLILRLVVAGVAGKPLVVTTGQGVWESSADGKEWAAVRRIGSLGCAPWGTPPNALAKPASTLFAVHPAWAGTPDEGVRAAQVLSAVCRDASYEQRIRAAFLRFAAEPEPQLKRTMGNNPSRPEELPRRNWILFLLARTLGELGGSASAPDLTRILAASPDEAHLGRPDPAEPNIHYLHNVCPPCWRGAVCWALGRCGDAAAVPTLLAVAGHQDNAVDVRHAAAVAIGRLAGAQRREELLRIAARTPETSVRLALERAAAYPPARRAP